MKISRELRTIINDSYEFARAQHHEFITPEHLLRQALNYRSVLSVLLTSGGDVTGIRKGLDEYLKKNIPVIAPVEEKKQSARAKKIAKTKTEHNSALEQNPIETMAFQAVMDRTCTHCVSSDKDVIDFSDVLVSMIDETKNYCSYILKQSGIERLKLIEVISYMRNNEQLLQNDTTTITPQDKQRMMEDMMRVIDNNESTQKKNTDATPIPDGYGDNVFQPQQPGGASTKTALEKYTTNLTQLAKDGKLETLIGREDEIERTVQILCRRTKNNPLHVGDAGVGKTAITEGLAVRIVNGEVPELLKDFSIYSLSMGTVLAGTRFRGDFEERLKQITDELMKKEKAILFIDEIHTIIGAGSVSNGTVDAANILKPMLSNGKIRCIGSTTFDEYTKIFEKDRALSRRFQKIDILEPTKDETVKIINGLAPRYASYHGVSYDPEALQTAVDLAVQYLPDRRLPDKAIDIMDEAGAWVKIHALDGAKKKTKAVKQKVPQVTVDVVRQVTAKMARVPLETLSGGEKDKLRSLDATLKQQIFGQDAAVESVVIAVKKARAGFRNTDRPEANFLFVGPTGVGKTELARVLAKTLGENLLRFDMSEYQEKHTVSRLIGSPPGYVGFEEGGLLTDAVRKDPHSIILLDEIEKAHEDIYNILLQVMDYGQLTDNQGRKADFRNCIIIMTSNVGARDMEKGSIGFANATGEQDDATLKEAVNKAFSPEFRNRLDAVIPFAHLSKDIVQDIARKEISRIAERLAVKKVTLTAAEEVVAFIADDGYSKEFGARNIARAAENKIASPLVDAVLFGKLSNGGKVSVVMKKNKIAFIYE